MNRDTAIKNIEDVPSWDMTVIGGGATGLGIALDAASRGFRTVLFEQSDFTKATSSRSTKLVHGGVRYLAQGDVRLVMEALHERGILRENAPHLVKDQAFLIPCYRCWDVFLYTAGLTLYDLLAGSLSFGRSLYKKRETTRQLLPSVKPEKLKGSVLYHDGSFDDSRLAVNLAETIFENGGFAMNYAQVTGILKNENGQVAGVKVVDLPNGKEYRVNARCVINATGIFVDDILKMDRPEIRPMIKPSQGVHLVVDGSFLNSREAIMIPKTSDGRVLFAVPWHGKTVIGRKIVAVYAFEFDFFAVEKILLSAAPALAEADTLADEFVACMQDKFVQRGRFGAPERRLLYPEFRASSRRDRTAFAEKFRLKFRAAQVFYDEPPRNIRFNLIIADVPGRAFQQIDAAENTAHAPFILRFEIGAFAPLRHDGVDRVLSCAKKPGNIVFLCGMTDLAVPDKTPVYKQIQSRIDALEIQVIPPPFFRRDGERSAVTEGGILQRHPGHIHRDGIARTGIQMPVVPVHLHAGRHRDRIRAGIAQIHIAQPRIIGELPFPVQHRYAGAVLPMEKNVFARFKGNVITAGRLFAALYRTEIFQKRKVGICFKRIMHNVLLRGRTGTRTFSYIRETSSSHQPSSFMAASARSRSKFRLPVAPVICW